MRRSRIRRSRFRISDKASLRRALIRELDQLCRARVMERDGWKCARCGSARHLQWSHIYSRRILALRWDCQNSLALCAGCHLAWHHRPLEGAAWFEARYPDRAVRLKLISRTPRKPDLKAIRLSLLS